MRALLCFIILGSGLNATDFEVAPGGRFPSLAAARDAARKLGPGQLRRIVVRAGRYFLLQPLVLDARDNGLMIEAAAGETVTLYGGRRVAGWQREGERFWSATVPAGWDFRMLVVNERVARPARLPAQGYFTHQSEFKVRWMSTTAGGWERKPTDQELTTLRYRPGDLGPWLDTAGAEITVYHMWDESLVRVKSIDDATHTVTFATPAGHPPGAFGVRKYVVWNVKEGMTEPGQWYFDRTAHKVVYWPLPGEEDMAAAEALAPATESVIEIKGTRERPVVGVSLTGLRIALTDTPADAGGFGAGHYAGAVALDYTENTVLRNLVVYNAGGQGIKARHAQGLRVLAAEVHHTGAGGVLLQASDSEVAQTHVHHVGQTYPSAIGIWCGGDRIRVHHNQLHDTPYSGMDFSGNDHAIEHNLIYRCMLELHDGAAIYTTFGKRMALRHNVVRDIPDTGGYGSSAYYLDEQSDDCIVENNISSGVARPSHNHMAHRNTIRNNLFYVNGDARLTFPRSSGYRVENNLIYATGKITVERPEAIAVWKGNVLLSGAGVLENVPRDTP
jgi:hypothetical protein